MGDIDDLDQAHHREPPGMGDATDPAGQEGPRPAAERTSIPPVTAAAAAQERRRRQDRLVGLGIVALTFGVSMLLSLWAKHASTPPTSEEPAPPTTVGLTGYPKKLDLLAALSLARELTKRPLLRGFVADGVSSKGVIDVRDKGSSVRFSFQSAPGQGAQPPREPGTLPTRTYCGRQNVLVKKDGIGAEPDVASFPCSSTPPTSLPDPRCRPEKLWALAKKKGVPTKSRARIEYFEARKGPAYRFSIPGTKHRFVVAEDCTRELKGKAALGNVP